MPVAEFAGRHGWGYDGVDLFAPSHLYGTPGRPATVRRSRRTGSGIGVILDVVYNHFGPGRQFPASVRAGVFLEPLRERMGRGDQLRRRCGAGARVHDRQCRVLDRRVPSGRPAARCHAADLRRLGRPTAGGIARRARAAAPERSIILVAENEPQDARLLRPARARAGSASTRCGTTTSITRRSWRSRAGARRTTRTTAARRRNSCRWRSGDSCIRASGTRGRSGGAARRRAGSRPARSSPFWRITIRSRMLRRAAASALHQRRQPGHVPRADGVVAAVARDADVLSGPGVRRIVAVLVLCRS